MRIRYKLIIILLIFSFIPFLSLGLIEITRDRRTLEKQIGNNSLEFSFLLMRHIDEYLYAKYINIQGWTKNKCLNDITSGDEYGNISQFLVGLTEIHDEYYYINCLNTNGQVVASNNVDLKGRDMSTDAGFKEALSGDKTMQDVMFNETAGEYAIVMSTPVWDIPEQSEIIGVLTVALKWDKVHEMVTSLKIGGKEQTEASHIMLFNKDGMVISCFDKKEMFSNNLIEAGMKSAKYAQEHKEGYLTETSEHGLSSFDTYTYSKEYKDLPQLDWNLILEQDPEIVFAVIGSSKKTLIITLLGTSVLLIIISFLFANRISKPILAVVSAARVIGKGDLNTKVPVKSNDEIGLLSTSFNEMVNNLKEAELEINKHRSHLETLVEERTKELKDAQEQLVLKEKLATVGQVSGSIVHELRNPMATIQNSSYYLSKVLKDPDDKVKKHLTLIHDTVQLSNNIINNILSLTRDKSLSLVKSDVNRVIKDVLTDFKTVEGITINTQLDEKLPTIPLDCGHIFGAFWNIISNSVQAMPEGGNLDIKTEMKDDFVGIEFKDTGTGISKENIQKIYVPLFTTRAKGMGLGLALVKTIIDKHNGSISVESEIGKGTTFTLRFPIATETTQEKVLPGLGQNT